MSRGSAMRGVLLFLIGVLVGANAVYFLLVRSQDCDCAAPPPPVAEVSVEPTPDEAAPSRPVDRPAAEREPADPAAGHTATPAGAAPPPAPDAQARRTTATPVPTTPSPTGLVVPVAGIAASDLSDTYDDPRGGGRVHEALDIMAPAGTPVFATADGTIEKLFDSDNGGLTIYQFDDTGTWCYYYAHLQRYAAGIRAGLPVWRGQVIAYVGDTGNAGRGNYHLHFSVSHPESMRRWWEGENTNPYPLLAGERARHTEGR